MKFKRLITVFLMGLVSSTYAQQDSVIKAKTEQEPTYQVFYNDGVTQLENKKYDVALGLFEQAVNMKADFERGYFLKGILLIINNVFSIMCGPVLNASLLYS